MSEQPKSSQNQPQPFLESTEVGSLSDYISKHLQKRSTEAFQNTDAPKAKNVFFNESHPAFHKPAEQATGLTLHHLDTQLANSHLERYLPTASIRYHLARERLSKELQRVYEELRHYRQFQGEEYQPKIEALENRATLLKRKLFELDHTMNKLNPFQSAYSAMQRFSFKMPSLPDNLNLSTLASPNRELRDEVTSLRQELASLQHILETQLHDPAFSSQQLGRLINEYDMSLHKVEKLMEQLKTEKSLPSRLSETLGNWVRQLNGQNA